MRRREKFVIAAALLGLGLFLVQFISLEYRYWAILLFSFVSYLISAWALAEDLQKFEWITILPFPTLYAGGVSLFYFLLPAMKLEGNSLPWWQQWIKRWSAKIFFLMT